MFGYVRYNQFYIRYISLPPYFILKIMILKVDLYTGKYGTCIIIRLNKNK